jgi:hypothetical protein
MRHLSFKILILCVVLPPLVYIYSIHFLEKAIQARYDSEISAVLIGDSKPLLAGNLRLQDVLQKNITAFIASRTLPDWGVEIRVTVTTKEGDSLYPQSYREPSPDYWSEDSFSIARENYRLLSEGLIHTIDVNIQSNSLLAIVILSVYALLSVTVLFLFYRRGAKKTRDDERATKEVIDGMADEHRRQLEQLKALENQHSGLSEKIAQMKKALDEERQKAALTEDEMVEELVLLEDRIAQHQVKHNEQLQEIDALKEKISQYENKQESQQRKVLKKEEIIRKRFNVLYQQVTFHDRAIEGFANLPEELQIKAEQVIHQLNQDPKMVPVKRKVFGKKNRETSFEVIFAYKGRLYYRTLPGRLIEILVIGTKLTQNKDLAFLNTL